MRKGIEYITLLIICCLFLGACNNELDMIHYSDPTPIVYGILCPDDSIHHIRLTKSFISESSPWDEAKIPDSQYFKNVTIQLELRSDNGSVIERVHFVEVVGNEKEDGVFFTEPNILYQTRGITLMPTYVHPKIHYYLTIYIPAIDQSVIAETLIPPRPGIRTNIRANDQINLFGLVPTYVIYGANANFSKNISIIINYLDKIDRQWLDKTIAYTIQRGATYGQPSVSDSLHLSASWFYPFMKNRIPDDPRVTHRQFKSITIRSQLIDQAYYEYFASLHYRSDLFENMLSNIEGGIGLFAAYSKTEKTGITLSQQSMDSLALGSITKHLKFSRW